MLEIGGIKNEDLLKNTLEEDPVFGISMVSSRNSCLNPGSDDTFSTFLGVGLILSTG